MCLVYQNYLLRTGGLIHPNCKKSSNSKKKIHLRRNTKEKFKIVTLLRKSSVEKEKGDDGRKRVN